ncbi:hypothetical protein T492DRAFT_932801 [Pavlovales sp. CCMP2436]|nr:hypothetical protein T492DRAFT_932801 [Pavlovales sp. CCMP2436]
MPEPLLGSAAGTGQASNSAVGASQITLELRQRDWPGQDVAHLATLVCLPLMSDVPVHWHEQCEVQSLAVERAPEGVDAPCGHEVGLGIVHLLLFRIVVLRRLFRLLKRRGGSLRGGLRRCCFLLRSCVPCCAHFGSSSSKRGGATLCFSPNAAPSVWCFSARAARAS